MTITKTGGCLCGAVRFTATLDEPHYHTCHCKTCRTWGGPAMAAQVKEMSIEDESKLSTYASSDYAERGFCTACGTHLTWRTLDRSFIGIPIGTFDDSDDLTFAMQLFIEQKPAHYTFANETATMTGEELFAAFAPKDG